MKIKTNKGITLISLVVTIIVLIILAGISINIMFGQYGIVTRSKQAKEEQEKQTATESMNLKITNIQIASYAENKELPNLQYLADKLCEDNDIEYVLTKSKAHASLDKIDVTNLSSIFTKLKDYPYEFEINSSLQLASIDGIKVATTEPNDKKTVYSDSEQIVGTWINNKPIYRKVISFSENVQTYQNVRYIRKEVIGGVEDIINSGGYFILGEKKINFGSSEIDWLTRPSFHSYVQVEENNLMIYILYNSENYSNDPITGTVWLEYTKTTD